MITLLKSTLSKLMDFSIFSRTPTIIYRRSRKVKVLPTGFEVLNNSSESVCPIRTDVSLFLSDRKVPYFRGTDSIEIKSGVVPSTVADATTLSLFLIVLVETAIGATAEIPAVFLIISMSEMVRLLFSKEFEDVSSSMIVVTESLVESGRTTIRSEPISEISLEISLETLPVRERIKIMLAIPIAIPRQVRNERVRFSLMEVRANFRWVRNRRDIIFCSFVFSAF